MTAADVAALSARAPAKINLYLHLRGRRPDGYHLLDSLVVFPVIGDIVTARPADRMSLAISGPFAEGLSVAGNLVLRAAERLASAHGLARCAALDLEKHLPLASGIGGGSSDAATTLRLLSRLWRVPVPEGLAIGLGADVPVCCAAPEPQLMAGIGEVLNPAPAMPDCWIVLVNPGVEVATAAVFDGIVDRNPPPGPPLPANGFPDFAALRDWLARQRNDLEASAQAICPAIAEVLTALSDAPLARMSGSGATCFALFATQREARDYVASLGSRTNWWVAAAPVSTGRSSTRLCQNW